MDLWDGLSGRRAVLQPSRVEIERIGGGSFAGIGTHLKDLAVDLGGLSPDQRVLDVGCGGGRLAVALIEHLVAGEYLGFDLHAGAIRWCRSRIEKRHPNFRFTHLDIRNDHYNPRGRIRAEEVIFPCASESVDVAFAASLFTHLMPAAANHYVEEIHRVLKPGGRFVGSFFVLDAQSRLVIDRTSPSFVTVTPEVAVQDPDDPEAAIAFDEIAVVDSFRRRGFEGVEIHRGRWAFREKGRSFQDVVIARKGDAGG